MRAFSAWAEMKTAFVQMCVCVTRFLSPPLFLSASFPFCSVFSLLRLESAESWSARPPTAERMRMQIVSRRANCSHRRTRPLSAHSNCRNKNNRRRATQHSSPSGNSSNSILNDKANKKVYNRSTFHFFYVLCLITNRFRPVAFGRDARLLLFHSLDDFSITALG